MYLKDSIAKFSLSYIFNLIIKLKLKVHKTFSYNFYRT